MLLSPLMVATGKVMSERNRRTSEGQRPYSLSCQSWGADQEKLRSTAGVCGFLFFFFKFLIVVKYTYTTLTISKCTVQSC